MKQNTGADTRIPIVLVTGAAGSGKSTWLQRVLAQPDMADSLLVAGPGSVPAATHPLVMQVQDETTPVVEAGCLCCTLRQDLVRSLVNALWRFSREGKRQYRRVFIEAEATADPVGLSDTLESVPAVMRSYRVGDIITVVNGCADVSKVPADEIGRAQLATANVVIVSHDDVLAADAYQAIRAELARLKPGASIRGGQNVYALSDD